VFNRVFRRLQIVRRIDNVVSRVAAKDRENRYTSMEKEGARAHQPISRRAWEWFEKNFIDVTEFVRSDDILPILVSQATLAKSEAIVNKDIRRAINNDFVGMTHPRLVASYEQATRIIERVAARKDAIYINGYDAVPPDLVHLHDHVHLIDPGAERLARVIAASLLGHPAFRALATASRN
jgi:hypothetical protein